MSFSSVLAIRKAQKKARKSKVIKTKSASLFAITMSLKIRIICTIRNLRSWIFQETLHLMKCSNGVNKMIHPNSHALLNPFRGFNEKTLFHLSTRLWMWPINHNFLCNNNNTTTSQYDPAYAGSGEIFWEKHFVIKNFESARLTKQLNQKSQDIGEYVTSYQI